jgi:hypothetical protein
MTDVFPSFSVPRSQVALIVGDCWSAMHLCSKKHIRSVALQVAMPVIQQTLICLFSYITRPAGYSVGRVLLRVRLIFVYANKRESEQILSIS